MRDTFELWEGRGQFAGHETFPLRLLWLKKSYDAVRGGVPIGTFHEPEAIVRFGVGRNMAVSMRYWATAAGIIHDSNSALMPTELGDAIFGDSGTDPFIERTATLWLVHWNFASEPSLTTTIFFAFNGISGTEFDVASINNELSAVVNARGWRAAPVTLRRDIDVFLRSYVRRDDIDVEDAAEPLLAELGLVRDMRPGAWFEFVRGPKPTLPNAVFAYALGQFWQRNYPALATLSAEQICYAVGSPGRVFKLDEDSVVNHLMRLEELTGGVWAWTDTAGLRQVQRRGQLDLMQLLLNAYPPRPQRNRRRVA
ncbi:DUF4007 family protein [Solimonas terrae]|uniref:DUF4007 family protein n=1 Tax=Solimonas terrae TaxID=1396819 RepID=A0A6M2BUM1_9GAMM|nr:DUF4007 family protein [Solimonas terrae]NGY05901.1 DUF4007 family protein [Solimonas terrae]